MKLSQLLKPLQIENTWEELDVTDIVFDSRQVVSGCAFVCMRGSQVDGHKFAEMAEQKGAAVIIAEEAVEVGVPVVLVPDTRKALALMSAAFFGNPADEDITVVGITGTKGKTTTATMMCAILESNGVKTGIMGTIGVGIGDTLIQTENTTPSSYEVQKYLRQMADAGCKICVMEVSSIGLKDLRVYGFTFVIGLFTNFSEDHIGGVEHKDMQEYLESKSMLFRMCRTGIINIDDASWQEMIQNHTCDIKTYGFNKQAELRAADYRLLSRAGFIGIAFDVTGKLNFTAEVGVPGRFNAYNALAAIACCHALGIAADKMNQGLRTVKVAGRMEPVEVPGDYTLLIDYAHNAVSMQNLLETLREYQPKRLVCLFGSGGNRPRLRRYEMGEVSGKLADLSVITADNSRFENVWDILEDIKTGLHKTNGEYIAIPDRKEAIQYCLQNAQAGDMIVLAGKGHEDYQDVNGEKFHFDEREIVADFFGMGGKAAHTRGKEEGNEAENI